LIDEFQDINPLQYRALKKLTAKGSVIFAVGDDDQAIYGFRGTNPLILKEFAKDYKADVIKLETNYRCPGILVSKALKMVGDNRERFGKNLKAKEQGGLFNIEVYETRDIQYRVLAEKIKNIVHDNPEDEVGILFRTNSYLQCAACILRRQGVRFNLKQRTGKLNDRDAVKDVIAYIKTAKGLYIRDGEILAERAWLCRIVNKPNRYISSVSMKGNVRIKGKNYINLCETKAFYENNQEEFGKKVAKNINTLIKDLLFIGEVNIKNGINFTLRKVGLWEYIREKYCHDMNDFFEYEDIMNLLMKEASTEEDVDKWEKSMFDYGEGFNDSNVKVNLSTVHGAKGLEYDRVFIPDCNEKVFPKGVMPDDKTVEEERRIFYVGMTRAKKELGLMYVTGTPSRPRFKSRFLRDL
ncbi:MAG: ATP-dependent helicase, partial [Lachnospiraceae bacterium]|nr:ATP-dependent helicase [Lachnospiraceae bacterium]